MQAAFIYLPSSLSFLKSNTLLPAHRHRHQCVTLKSTSISIKVNAAATAAGSDAPEVDYNSMESSVFPAEACETLGGVACDAEMFPETKLKQEAKPKAVATTTTTGDTVVDREYLQYDNPKTVFVAEACDDLGGEFCEPTYQTGHPS